MFKNHPTGLKVLFFANMGERFGYYTTLTLFTLYLQERFGWSASQAGDVYGVFGFMVYFMPLLGGLLADRWLGYSKTITIGTVIMTLGYALLGIPSQHVWMLYAALGVIAIGNGLFKGNLVVLVGNLYDQDRAPLRDAAFNIYYMGINIGAFFAPFAAHWISQYARRSLGMSLADGYNLAFGLASITMVISMVIFIVFRKHYTHVDLRSGAKGSVAAASTLTREQEKERVVVLFIVFGIVIFFWVAFQQAAFTLTLFAKNYTADLVSRGTFMLFNLPSFLGIIALVAGLIFALQRGASGLQRGLCSLVALAGAGIGAQQLSSFSGQNAITPELFQAFNPVFIVSLTPLVIGFFAWLKLRDREPSSPAKIGLGMLFTALAFGVMVLASLGLPSVAELGGGRSGAVVSPYWLISTYFILTVAELCLRAPWACPSSPRSPRRASRA